MLLRSLAISLFVASSFVFVTGQTPDAAKQGADKTAKTTPNSLQPLRDIPFPAGVDLKFLIKELARDIDLNVLFDPESRLEFRTVKIELKNVTVAAALKYIFLQERLISEEVGPGTILVSVEQRGKSIPQIGVGVEPLTEQLARYFGVNGGLLINYVRSDSPAAKAGLKAGDVIVDADGVAVRGALAVIRAIDGKRDGDTTLRIVRDRKDERVDLRLNNNLP